MLAQYVSILGSRLGLRVVELAKGRRVCNAFYALFETIVAISTLEEGNNKQIALVDLNIIYIYAHVDE